MALLFENANKQHQVAGRAGAVACVAVAVAVIVTLCAAGGPLVSVVDAAPHLPQAAKPEHAHQKAAPVAEVEGAAPEDLEAPEGDEAAEAKRVKRAASKDAHKHHGGGAVAAKPEHAHQKVAPVAEVEGAAPEDLEAPEGDEAAEAKRVKRAAIKDANKNAVPQANGAVAAGAAIDDVCPVENEADEENFGEDAPAGAGSAHNKPNPKHGGDVPHVAPALAGNHAAGNHPAPASPKHGNGGGK